tara:strand:- start:801 stop:1196 length:396 start_codon:yes stop_codon:yes gene_type:complete
MLTLISLSICFFCIILTGWTFTTYFIKKDSQEFIIEELKNLFNICKKFFISLKNLIGILANNSHSSEPREVNPIYKDVLDENEQPLSLVEPVKEIEERSLKVTNETDNDIALSSFSPEVIEVINEEEEKVA